MQPDTNEVPMNCTACLKHWMGKVVVGIPVTMFSKLLKEVTCPFCHANWKRVTMGYLNDIPKEEYRVPPT